MRAATVHRAREDKEKEYPDARLDDLSTYEKIAFYKLVSRKELEGIADGLRSGRQVRQRRVEGMSEPRVRREGRDEGTAKRKKEEDRSLPRVRAK